MNKHVIKSVLIYILSALFFYANIYLFNDSINIKTWDWGSKYAFCVFNGASLFFSLAYFIIEKPKK